MVSFHSLEGLLLTVLLSVYFPTNYAQQETTLQPEVTISQGTLQGITLSTRNNRSISGFLGIPYAKPPTGDLRFANPVAADGWNGTRNASADGSMCFQIPEDPSLGGAIMGDEDCLFINVYTPQLPQTANSSLLPVMVFVHGGGFLYGSHASTMIGPEYLLDEDVVLVAMNYRLGPLGFLSTGDEIASGNWGLKDQILALEWVQKNIQHFGGDPDQVTLIGESAGAVSVHFIVLSNAPIGLFHRYIIQSGSALAVWGYRTRASHTNLAFELGRSVGCSNNTSNSLISCLRAQNASDIMATQSEFVVEYIPDIKWCPTDEPDIDGAILTDSPYNLLAAGNLRDLPSISGVCRDEGLLTTSVLYETDETPLYYYLSHIDSFLPSILGWTNESQLTAAWINATMSYYFNDMTADTSVLLKNLTVVVGDGHFYYPARSALQQQYTLTESPQYFYIFNYEGTKSTTNLNGGSMANYGVSHADDLFYLFPSYVEFSDLNKTMSETDYEMVDIMVQLWTSFAINGTPTAVALNGAVWEPYSVADAYLRIGNDSDTALEVQYSFFEERMQFWASLYATSNASGTIISSRNSLFSLLVACSTFILSAATADRFR